MIKINKDGNDGIRTHEAFAVALETTPFDHSGTLPFSIIDLLAFQILIISTFFVHYIICGDYCILGSILN